MKRRVKIALTVVYTAVFLALAGTGVLHGHAPVEHAGAAHAQPGGTGLAG